MKRVDLKKEAQGVDGLLSAVLAVHGRVNVAKVARLMNAVGPSVTANAIAHRLRKYQGIGEAMKEEASAKEGAGVENTGSDVSPKKRKAPSQSSRGRGRARGGSQQSTPSPKKTRIQMTDKQSDDEEVTPVDDKSIIKKVKAEVE